MSLSASVVVSSDEAFHSCSMSDDDRMFARLSRSIALEFKGTSAGSGLMI